MSEDEICRWQDAIRVLLLKHAPKANIDGGGCDSGDPLDLTLCEISQAFAYFEDRAFDALQEIGLDSEGYDSALDAVLKLFPDDGS